MQILFQRTDRNSGEKGLLGYTVVKFSGDRFCKYWLDRKSTLLQNACINSIIR